MKVELIKVDGKTIGYKLVAETKEEKLQLGSIRNMEYFGMNETALEYAGRESEQTSEGEYVTALKWKQAMHNE